MDIQRSIKDLKVMNQQSKSKAVSILKKIMFSLLLLGTILFVLDSDRFLTVFVLSIFFTMILGMITLFVFLLNKQQLFHRNIRNTIDLIYTKYLQLYNDMYQTSYDIYTDKKHDMIFKLVPSFANEDTTFLMTNTNNSVNMVHTSLYNQTGENQRRTYYFSGLYIQIQGIEGDTLYRDKETLSSLMIQALKSVIDQDTHVFKYQHEESFHNGKLSFNQNQQSDKALIKNLLDTIEAFQLTHRIDILIENNTLHIALSLKQMSLPRYKTYHEDESNIIKGHVETYAKLLQAIETLL